MAVFKFYSDADFELACNNVSGAVIDTTDSTISVEDKCKAREFVDKFDSMKLAFRIYNEEE